MSEKLAWLSRAWLGTGAEIAGETARDEPSHIHIPRRRASRPHQDGAGATHVAPVSAEATKHPPVAIPLGPARSDPAPLFP